MGLMFRFSVYAFFITWINTYTLQAQQFGGNPPSIKWQQVNTGTAKVIFPKGLDSIAKEVAGIVQQISGPTLYSIGPKLRKVSIVLQQEPTNSNGYVALGPFRSEFYLTPLQNSFSLGSLPWHEQLAVHEFRHVQQINNYNVGLSKLFRVIFGEEGQALANALVLPDWFDEGDAVFNETLVTGQGRGRLPFFFNDYRSLWLGGKNYSWMKLRNGSLRDFIPDRYKLGYMLVAYGRQKFGDEFWKNVTHDAASYQGLFYPLQKAIKKYTGDDYRAFRNNAMNYFRSQLDGANKPLPPEAKLSKGHFLADEEYPAFINDSTVLFMKSSYKQLPAFTIRSGTNEKRVRVKDVTLDEHFSYRKGNIVYASSRPDLRWGWKSYNDIKLLDVQTGRQRSVTSHTRYFSPDISEDGATITAVKVDPSGASFLHFIDAGNGLLITAIANPDHLFYTYPKFYNAKQVITPVRNKYGKMSLALVDGSNGTTSYLTPFSLNVIGFPFILGDTVYFTSSYNEKDRLFACSITDKKLYELIPGELNGITGSYQPVVNNNKLMWSHFTANGYRLEEMDKKDLKWENISAETFDGPLYNFGVPGIDKNPAGSFSSADPLTVSRYPKSYHLVNFHSFHPLVDDPVYSFSLVGENVLNTLQTELFGSYNRNEQSKELGFNTTYGGWFPFVSAGATYTLDRRSLYHNQRIYWDELELRGGANLPLNLSKGRNLTYLNVGADFVYNQPSFKGRFKDSIGNQSFSYANTYLTFTNRIQQARQHIYPRFAQTLLLNYKKAISNFDASQFLITGSLYLPGLWQNHNLVLNAAFQQKDTLNQRSFSNSFPFSRGYSAENFYRMKKWGANYHFPLCYPDAGFGNIVYLLRLRSNVFYDHTVVTDFRLNTGNFRSAGTELFFDTKWWNQLPLSVGFRYSYLLDRDLFGGSGHNRFEFILPVNLLDQ